MTTTLRAPAALAALLLLAAPAAAQPAPTPTTVDAVFQRFAGERTPGCAVGVSRGGAPELVRAYGMASLEHDVPNTAQSVFEAGSVSKQFTAAAVTLLALEGKLSLDDDVRRWIPELPEYEAPITIRHLLNHTSGLRDWGSVAAVGGWPRGTRVHTHEHMLDIAARQRALNYPPGEHYSYTNTGYNLQAVLVERVSGVPFAEFSRTRIFEPLGLTRTQWRDDFARVVEDRAIGYRPARGGAWRWDMPFENVHGNGGLLTTVEDLLRWTSNLETGELGGPAFVAEMHRQGVLNSGRTIDYASGLVVGEYKGVPEVSHGGATAGYRAYLARYPEQGVAVALLCNAANANPGMLAHQVADLYLADAIAAHTADAAAGGETTDAPAAMSPETLAALAGLYRDTRTHDALRLVLEEGRLRIENGPPLRPLDARRFQVGSGPVFAFGPAEAGERPPFHAVQADGDSVPFVPAAPAAPTPAELGEYAGTYHSDEAEATYTVAVEGARLVLLNRYGRSLPLTPIYRDAFDSPAGTFRFIRDGSGRIEALSAISSRVWDLRFHRRP